MNGKFPAFRRNQIENRLMRLVDRSIANNAGTSDDLPSSALQGIDSSQESHVSPTHVVIASSTIAGASRRAVPRQNTQCP